MLGDEEETVYSRQILVRERLVFKHRIIVIKVERIEVFGQESLRSGHWQVTRNNQHDIVEVEIIY